ncbi:MAG: hypothetical protein A9Z00_15380 [Thermobacillus sp. ZCTH02-B1]|uniref:hypothetical protein n=1 Tax=Thermobacillus sp. ZCTH02-B1 TaxID=1858795 RepID=UPI000B57228F|nr:hypothetical protein [Thermobacillus sp. ZCTH02-B1]OUM94078.1 MAG: hypothetical protein A9Z00_15380 [Thermobacillus sp. ZCTH02-B1]
MRRFLLTAAIMASIILPVLRAPAAGISAAQAAGFAFAPSVRQQGTESAVPARIRGRADRCASASLHGPDGLARRAAFTVFAPRELPAGWIPAVCAYPTDRRGIGGLRIHLHAAWTALPAAGALEPRIAGIAQTRAIASRLAAGHGRPVRLRGTVARFMPWHPAAFDDGRPVHGGILRWIERGTLIEIDSRILTKKQMIRLAESLAPVPARNAGVPTAGNLMPERGLSAGNPASASDPLVENPATLSDPSDGSPGSAPGPVDGNRLPAPEPSAGFGTPASGPPVKFPPPKRPKPAVGLPFGPRLPFSPGGSILGPGDIRA